MPVNQDQPRSRVEVDDDGTVVASAEVDLPEGSPAARAALHVEPGHHAPGTSTRLVDAVLETEQVRQAGRLVAAVPKGDGEAIAHVHERIPSATTRAAGSTVIVEAQLEQPQTEPGQPKPEQTPPRD